MNRGLTHTLPRAGKPVLLCDADGNLFGSEAPAFDASHSVVNDFLKAIGSARRFSSEQLRRQTTGRNFRSTATWLAELEAHPLSEDEIERWVQRERHEVTAHLELTLKPDEAIRSALLRLSEQYDLAIVTSSALSRVERCLHVTGLSDLFIPGWRFSAEDSLPVPRSKPHPDIYLHALAALGATSEQALAIEDSVPGVCAASAAGVVTLGNTTFVAADERVATARELQLAGALAVFSSWEEVVDFATGCQPARVSVGVRA
jgi:beta-phosphoglucomutase-like phosphatase (HAD superfamily)